MDMYSFATFVTQIQFSCGQTAQALKIAYRNDCLPKANFPKDQSYTPRFLQECNARSDEWPFHSTVIVAKRY
jgi:hypothetical protein